MRDAGLATLALPALLLLAVPVAAAEVSEAIASEAGAPAAKEGARTDKEATKVDAEALLDRIATASRELVVRMDTLRSGEGEQATDLLRDLARIGREQRADLEAVLDQIAQRKKMGSEVRGLVERSRQLLRRASRLRRGVIRKAEAETMEEAARRDSLAPDERFLFEHDLADRSALLDRTYEGLVAISEEMEEVGLDVSAERAFLERRLSERALLLLDEARGAREALMAPELQAAPGADVAVLETREFALEERADGSATSLLATIRLLDRLGIDTQDLAAKAAEVAAVVAPPASEAAAEAAESQARHWIAETRDFLRLRGPSLLLRLLVAIGVLVLSWLLARVARRITGWMVDRTRIASSRILRDTIVRVVGRVILVLGVIVALWQLGFAASPLLAGLGIVGVVVGFALQDTLANFAAGGMILAYRPYDVGDVIEAAGITGKVQEMNVVSTRILTFDHQTLIVPNGKIWGDVIRNVTSEPRRRVDMEFGIAYEDDVEKAERVLREIVTENEKVLDDPEPMIKLHRLGESSVDFVVRPWAKTEDYWDVYWEVTREVKLRFDREGISIPFPQRDVHLIGGSAPEPEEDEG